MTDYSVAWMPVLGLSSRAITPLQGFITHARCQANASQQEEPEVGHIASSQDNK